jgi:hypothetical protein
MATLIVTEAQKTLLDSIATYLQDAFTFGVQSDIGNPVVDPMDQYAHPMMVAQGGVKQTKTKIPFQSIAAAIVKAGGFGTGSGGATSAAAISYAPGGNISATNVQAAIQELDNEKVAKSGDIMSGSLNPNGDLTLDLGGANRWRRVSTGNIYDGANIRFDLSSTPNVYRANRTDGSTAVAHLFYNTNALTASGSKLIQVFSDNGVTERFFINNVGVPAPAADNATTLGLPGNRWSRGYILKISDSGTDRLDLGSSTAPSIYRGTVGDNAGSSAHQFGNSNLLTGGVDRYIASFYQGNIASPVLRITSNGSVIPDNDATIAIGGTSNRVADIYAINIHANSSVNRILLSTGASGGNTYRGEITSGSSTIAAHTFANSNTLSNAADKIASFWAGNASTLEKLWISKDGVPTPATDNTTDVGSQTNRFASLFATSWKDGSGAFRILIGNATFNDYRSTVSDGSTAVAHKFRNTNSLVNATAKLLQVFSDDGVTERFSILASGGLISSSGATFGGNVVINGTLDVVSNAQVMRLAGTDHTYFGFFPTGTGAARRGWMGFGSAGTNTLSITNEAASSGDITITTGTNGNANVVVNGTGNVTVNGTFRPTADNSIGAGSTAQRWSAVHTVALRANTTSNRVEISGGSQNRYLGEFTNGSTAIAHQFGNTSSLTTVGSRIAEWYSDNFTTLRSFLERDGSQTWRGNLNIDQNLSATPVGMLFISNSTRFGTWRNNSRWMPLIPGGRRVNKNTQFLDGLNGYSVYANVNTGPYTTHSIVADNTAPNASGQVLRVSYNGLGTPGTDPSPGLGGFVPSGGAIVVMGSTGPITGTQQYTRGNRYLQRLWAKVPVGYDITWAANQLGDGVTNPTYLTPRTGTGSWMEYLIEVTIGNTAGAPNAWSSFGHIYIVQNGGANVAVDWDVALYEVIDLDNPGTPETGTSLNLGYTMGLNLDFGMLATSKKTLLALASTSDFVGVGTSGPGFKFEVAGASGTVGHFFGGTNLSTESAFVMAQSRARFGYDGGNGVVRIDDVSLGRAIWIRARETTGNTDVNRFAALLNSENQYSSARQDASTGYHRFGNVVPVTTTTAALFQIYNDNFSRLVASVDSQGRWDGGASLRGTTLQSLSTPTNSAFTQGTGGTLADGTYAYRVTATIGGPGATIIGETAPSTETTITVSGGGGTASVTVNWNYIKGATGYKVYGRTSGAELLLATITNGHTISFVDDGTVTPSGAMNLVNSSSSIAPSSNNGSFVGNPNLRFLAGYFTGLRDAANVDRVLMNSSTSNVYTGNISDGSGVLAHRFGNNNNLFNAGANLIGFYADANTRLVGWISAQGTYNGSVFARGGINTLVLSTPGQPTLQQSAGGSLADATYSYRVSATTPGGETTAGTAQTIAVTGGGGTASVVITWSYVTHATGYNIYGRIGGSELKIATISGGHTLTFTDDGSVTPAGALPALNSTGSIYPQSNGSQNLGDPSHLWLAVHALGVRDAANTIRFGLGASTFNEIRGTVADGSSAIVCKIGNTNSIAASGAVLLNVYSDNMSTIKFQVNRLGTILPGTDIAADLGAPTLRYSRLHTVGLRGSTTTDRVNIGTTTNNSYLGEVVDAAAAVLHKFGNTNTMTSGSDRFAAVFYRDNLTTSALNIGTNGSLIPGTTGTASIGGSANTYDAAYILRILDTAGTTRWQAGVAGASGQNVHRGSTTDAASSVAHQFGNLTSLAAGTDRYIAVFYRDSMTTAVSRITSDGSYIPVTDNSASLGKAALRFASVFTVRIKDDASNDRFLLPSTSANSYIGTIANGSSAVAHKFGNLNNLATTGAKVISVYRDNLINEVAAIARDGMILSPGIKSLDATTLIYESGLAAGNGTTPAHQIWVTNAMSYPDEVLGVYADAGSNKIFSIDGSGRTRVPYGIWDDANLNAGFYFADPGAGATTSALIYGGARVEIDSAEHRLRFTGFGTFPSPAVPAGNITWTGAFTFDGSVDPNTDGGQTLGDPSVRWASLYSHEAVITNATLTDPGNATSVFNNGNVRTAVYKANVSYFPFSAASPDQAYVIATLPAKTKVVAVYTQTDTAFTGVAGTLTASIGITSTNYDDFILAHDILVTGNKGSADADLGTKLARATAVQGGHMNFTGTTDVKLRLVSGTGNLGNGTVTNLTDGAITIWIITERLP